MAKIIVTITRTSAVNGNTFKTAMILDHRPVDISPDVAGWNGCGSGLSNGDLQCIFAALTESAANISSFHVELVDEVE